MSVDAVLDAARCESGSRRLRPTDFIERLGLLLGEVDGRRQRVEARTRRCSSDQCTKAAANRLLIQHYWSEHPEVARRARSSGRST